MFCMTVLSARHSPVTFLLALKYRSYSFQRDTAPQPLLITSASFSDRHGSSGSHSHIYRDIDMSRTTSPPPAEGKSNPTDQNNDSVPIMVGQTDETGVIARNVLRQKTQRTFGASTKRKLQIILRRMSCQKYTASIAGLHGNRSGKRR
jgi:hypothetical protein